MLPHKTIARFLIGVTLICAILLAPWPPVRDAYAHAFRAAGELGIGSWVPSRDVRFLPSTSPHDYHDTAIVLVNRETGETAELPALSSRQWGYVPTVLIIALVLATPIPRRRRAWALIWGVLLVNAFIILRLAVLVVYAFGLGHPARLYVLSSFSTLVLRNLVEVLCDSIVTCAGVPFPIWILVSFRRTDWARWVQADAHPGVHRGKGRVGR